MLGGDWSRDCTVISPLLWPYGRLPGSIDVSMLCPRAVRGNKPLPPDHRRPPGHDRGSASRTSGQTNTLAPAPTACDDHFPSPANTELRRCGGGDLFLRDCK